MTRITITVRDAGQYHTYCEYLFVARQSIKVRFCTAHKWRDIEEYGGVVARPLWPLLPHATLTPFSRHLCAVLLTMCENTSLQ